MNSLGHVRVAMSGVIDLEGGQTFLVTFLDADIGDAEILHPNTVGLSGLGKAVTVREEIKGSLAVGDALHFSYKMTIRCSISQVSHGSCGDPIQQISLAIDSNSDFNGDPVYLNFEPDYSVQFIKIWSESFASRDFEQPAISGYFQLSDGESTTEPGSSFVTCSDSCTCNFNGLNGLQTNDLIRLADERFRVSSSFIISETQFELGRVDGSLVKDTYIGNEELFEADLFVWSGGYEWKITFHEVAGQIRPWGTIFCLVILLYI
mmetsp:Transcript_23284/g.33868  ORF Transcript_23284/g.33868 Transcript_23284/m.33868 type:complete len:263 (-) Transcript_23284:747-1535(-)